ncbi:MAG: type II 3-dehydroquinate dehydratase [Alphaproteobacteria bacterium]|nr:type II 3-dehydroquinate dehydratase [Alphaproteobacteria bacterium]
MLTLWSGEFRGRDAVTATNTVLIINGPNLNMLGAREPEIYGTVTLPDIESMCQNHGKTLGFDVDFRQSNAESDLISWIQDIDIQVAGLIINAGAYTHTSIALLDALKTINRPIIEVHLSNVYSRETFRHRSYISPAATGTICGFGPYGYVMALDALADQLRSGEDTG